MKFTTLFLVVALAIGSAHASGDDHAGHDHSLNSAAGARGGAAGAVVAAAAALVAALA